jgi:hypothetical protein
MNSLIEQLFPGPMQLASSLSVQTYPGASIRSYREAASDIWAVLCPCVLADGDGTPFPIIY